MRVLLAIAALALVGAPLAAGAQEEEVATAQAHPEATPYDPRFDATAAVDAALDRAALRGTLVMIVLGANWCHDSRAFAGWTEADRIGGLIAEKFELVFVNVGRPQTGDGFNQHILARFGFEPQEGTPMVIVATPGGDVLNRDSAASWRNAASRSEDEIYDELASLASAGTARD